MKYTSFLTLSQLTTIIAYAHAHDINRYECFCEDIVLGSDFVGKYVCNKVVGPGPYPGDLDDGYDYDLDDGYEYDEYSYSAAPSFDEWPIMARVRHRHRKGHTDRLNDEHDLISKLDESEHSRDEDTNSKRELGRRVERRRLNEKKHKIDDERRLNERKHKLDDERRLIERKHKLDDERRLNERKHKLDDERRLNERKHKLDDERRVGIVEEEEHQKRIYSGGSKWGGQQ